MENVPGMAQMGVVEQVVEDLSCGGKYVHHPRVIDAADLGMAPDPQAHGLIGYRHRAAGRGLGRRPREVLNPGGVPPGGVAEADRGLHGHRTVAGQDIYTPRRPHGTTRG